MGASKTCIATFNIAKPTAIASAGHHTIALKGDGTVWTWGRNSSGQLGDGTLDSRLKPVQVVGPSSGFLTGVTAISSGYDHTITLKGDGTVWTWGNNDYGQLGDGTAGLTARRLKPVQVVGPSSGFLTGVTAISSGGNHTIALKGDGTVWTWGYNGYGQLGDTTTTNRSRPVQVLGPGTGFLTGITAIEGRQYHTVALKGDGTVWTWGDNTYGQLGDGTTTRRLKPVQVVGSSTGFLTGITAVSGGAYHVIALKGDGTVWTWGYNYYGQLGNGTTTGRLKPVQVVGPSSGFLTGVTKIGAGSFHTIALKGDKTVWTWGDNDYGQLGDGTATRRYRPVQVVSPAVGGFLADITEIEGGILHTITLKGDGSVWTWGDNVSGQLGDGTTTRRYRPVQALLP